MNILELRAVVDAATSDNERLDAILDLAAQLLNIDPRESLMFVEQGLVLAQRLQDKRSQAHGLRLCGEVDLKLGNYKQSRGWFERAGDLYQSLGDLLAVAKVHDGIGGGYLQLGRYSEALEHHQASRAIFESLGDRAAIGRTEGSIGNVYYRLGNYDRSLEHWQYSLRIAEESGDQSSIAYGAGNIGNIFLGLGEYAKALEQYDRALKIHEELGFLHDIAIWKGSIGNVYYNLGELLQALAYYQSAVALQDQLGDRGFRAGLTINIAHVYLQLGEYDHAIDQIQFARGVAEELGIREYVVGCTEFLGNAYLEMGEYARALEQYQSAQPLYEELGNQNLLAVCIGSIGQIYAIKSFEGYDPVLAEELLLHTIDLAVESRNNPFLVLAHQWLAELYKQQEKWEQALRHFTRSHELKEEIRGHEAYKTAQQFEHRREIAEMEKRHAIERTEAELQRVKAEQIEKELGNTTLQLLAQTELLRDLRNDLLKISRRIPPSEPAARELRERIKNLPCNAVDWEKFDRQFKAAHPDFIRTLIGRAPELTVTEVRICTMLRMNLNSHEIASLFCITNQGVDFHRANIRRKLQLKKDEKLPLVLGAM